MHGEQNFCRRRSFIAIWTLGHLLVDRFFVEENRRLAPGKDVQPLLQTQLELPPAGNSAERASFVIHVDGGQAFVGN